jgi:prepilin-type processing-associated H-X9-DG protein
VWSAQGVDLDAFPRIPDTVPVTHTNWAVLLLPRLDQQPLRNQFDPESPMISAANAAARATPLPAMNCPSDSYNVEDNVYTYENEHGQTAVLARGNYAINGGPHDIYEAPGSLSGPRPLGTKYAIDFAARTFQWWGEGVAGINKCFSRESFANGLATTVAVNEVRAGILPSDPRGVWALGQIGGSITWAHGLVGDAGGPNPTLANADDILGGEKLHALLGRDRIVREHMTFCDHCNQNGQASSRSMHPGGVNALMCDGAVRFVVDEVDKSIWHSLHACNTPRDVLADMVDDLPNDVDRRELDAAPRVIVDPADAEPLVTNTLGMQFRLIPAGTFTMGLPDEGNAHNLPPEVPAHKVEFSVAFYMGMHEVTQEQFESVVGNDPSSADHGTLNATGIDAAADYRRRPVENVSWNEAVEFCRRLSEIEAEQQSGRSYRLPTEAEWEYCCRSGSTAPYQHDSKWHDDDRSGEIAGKAWREDPPSTVPVGSYPPNAFGLYDMRGNVWEWCSDWFGRDYYSWSGRVDPRGPVTGKLKVYRGSDWVFIGDNCKTGSRALPPSSRSPFIGFRVVCDQSEPQ